MLNYQKLRRPLTYKELLVQESLKYIGHPSVKHQDCVNTPCNFGDHPETGFDCSGFITYLLREIGFSIPPKIRHCDQYFLWFGIPLHAELATAGDLVFFSRDGRRATHMGIALSESRFIHSPGKNNSTIRISEIKPAPIVRRYDNGAHIFDHNPIGYKRLVTLNGDLITPSRRDILID